MDIKEVIERIVDTYINHVEKELLNSNKSKRIKELKNYLLRYLSKLDILYITVIGSILYGINTSNSDMDVLVVIRNGIGKEKINIKDYKIDLLVYNLDTYIEDILQFRDIYLIPSLYTTKELEFYMFKGFENIRKTLRKNLINKTTFKILINKAKELYNIFNTEHKLKYGVNAIRILAEVEDLVAAREIYYPSGIRDLLINLRTNTYRDDIPRFYKKYLSKAEAIVKHSKIRKKEVDLNKYIYYKYLKGGLGEHKSYRHDCTANVG